MTSPSGGIPTLVVEFARRSLGPGATLTEVAGDASTRRFYRATAGRTAIVMAHGEPLPADAPFYSNHRILAAIGAPVPRILDRDDPAGLVLVEDFGDLTLQRHLLEGGDPDGRGRPAGPALYRQAADLIILMQTRGQAALQPADFAARNALDRDRFLFELDHFHKHFIGGLRGMTPEELDDRRLRAFYDELAEACDRLPRVYCHRDFQSRNLMVRDTGEAAGSPPLGLIDFQDARMGPYCYDAASLLRDSSLDIDARVVEASLERLAAGSAAPLGIGPEEFRRDFDLMALERNIKDLGTFGYMATVRGRRDYLDYIPRTLASVRRTLLGDRRWHDAHVVMDRLVLDWRG